MGWRIDLAPQKWFESMLENNPLRGYVRDVMEVKPLRAATGVGRIPHALHVACGNGDSTRLVLRQFPADKLSAIDRDDELIAAACKMNGSESVDFSVQDVCSLRFKDNSFDAAFDLADLHNTQDWKVGVRELHRVLKPGGLLILEELSQETFAYAAGKLFKALTDHPYDSMLTMEGFRDHVLQTGFDILHFEEKCPFGLLKYFVMVARKA
jgi:ubiquinone/menaquinone biosynthesis C-methylase UbiE